MMTMPFGKYRGWAIADLPGDYLAWLDTIELRDPLRAAVASERDRRTGPRPRVPSCPSPTIAQELIGAGLRSLARRYHPDAGGTHEGMIAATAAADWLRSQLRGLPSGGAA